MSEIDEEERPRAFVVARLGERTWITDLPVGEAVAVGSDPGAGLHLDEAQAAAQQFELLWDGKTVRIDAKDGTFVGGKRFAGKGELKPGDEIAIGGAQLVIGVTAPLASAGRRALTHHEFRERLYEELARAQRVGRPTALVMLAARAGDGGRIASTALDSFRGGDVVGTYASDEPEMLLPDTDWHTARVVIERLLANAEAEAVIGLAVAPDHGDSPERLLRAARRALAEAQRKGASVLPPPEGSSGQDQKLAVEDPVTLELVSALEDAAADPDPILLLGERSAGKSAFARLVHRSSGRKGAFVTLHGPAAVPEESLDLSALEDAQGGTLFVDEIGELPLEQQKALLGFVDDESRDVRLVATTHRALHALVERQVFDATLYDLVGGRVLEVPALRNRPGDILPLATQFALEAGAREPVKFAPGAIARLHSYPWPGNVLELRNAMERAVRLAGTGEILTEHLPSEPMPIASSEGRLREHVDSVERDAIIKALADSNHNQTHAAKRLGISRRALIYKMEKYGLKRPPRGSRKSES